MMLIVLCWLRLAEKQYEREMTQLPIWDEIKHDRFKINTFLNNRLMHAWEHLSTAEQQPYFVLEGELCCALTESNSQVISLVT